MSSLADNLELAMTAGLYTPGRGGWRASMIDVAATYLTTSRQDLGGDSFLDRIHTERRSRWADSRGPRRAALTAAVLPMITPTPRVPAEAEVHLAPIRWLLHHADGDGAPLTVNHLLGPALLTEGCHRLHWLTVCEQAHRKTNYPRRSGCTAFWTNSVPPAAAAAHCCSSLPAASCWPATTPALWTRVAATLFPADEAKAAAAEIMLMLMLTDAPPSRGSPTVADILTGEGWRADSSEPLTAQGTSC